MPTGETKADQPGVIPSPSAEAKADQPGVIQSPSAEVPGKTVTSQKPVPAPASTSDQEYVNPQLSEIPHFVSKATVWIILAGFVILLIFIPISFYILFSVLTEKPKDGPSAILDTTDKIALAASIQVAFAMLMGFVSVFIGLLITWFGIRASFELGGKVGEKVDASLKSASPGLVFFLAGIVLIGVALYKPLKYESSGESKKVPTTSIKGLPPTTKSEP